MTDRNIEGAPGDAAGTRLREDLAEATHAIKAEAAHFAAAAGDNARDKVTQAQATLGDGIGQFADALRKAGDDLQRGDQSLVSGWVRQASDGLESVARGVAGKRPEELLHAVGDFGRKNPGALIVASVLAGLAVGRLARASGERGQSQNDGEALVDASPSQQDLSAQTEKAPPMDLDQTPRTLFGDNPVTPGVAPPDDALSDPETLSMSGDRGPSLAEPGARHQPAAREDQEV